MIILPDDICYGVLKDMAKNLAKALRMLGEKVEICDLADSGLQKFAEFYGKKYQAVICYHRFFSRIYLPDSKCFLTDLYCGPTLEMVFDHPFWFYEQLKHLGSDYYIVSHDEYYVAFAKKYYSGVAGSFFLPPGGVLQGGQMTQRDLDVVFLGTYTDYRAFVREIYLSDKNERYIAARYLYYLRKFTDMSAEDAFSRSLADYGVAVTQDEFARAMYRMSNAYQCVEEYYREKMIKTILEAGIAIHVYGESWKQSPFVSSPYLICHDEVRAEENASILKRAKISLNILSGHRAGCNERIINSMLSGAVCVTGKSAYIERNFLNGEELCYFDLKQLDSLSGLIQDLLEQDEVRQRIAMQGRKKAEKEYSMVRQAQRLIEIVGQINL